MPRLPRKTKVDVTWCDQVPRLPRTVPRRHARPSGPKRATQCRECHACHAKRPWMWVCATPATWNQGGCHQVPCLPRTVPRRHSRPSGPKRATQCHECHACHAKRLWMWDCATPATWNQGGCHQVPRLPRKSAAASRATKRAQARHSVDVRLCHLPREIKVDVTKCHAPRKSATASHATKRAQARHPVPWVPRPLRPPRKTTVDVSLCQACHVKSRWMSPSAMPATQKCRDCATPATWNQGGCHQVPRLPCKSAAASRATKRAQARHSVDVRLCHACHVNSRWMSPSATPATHSAAASRATKRAQDGPCHECHACHARPWMWDCATPATWNQSGCHQVSRLPRKSAAASCATKRAQARHPVPWVPRLPRKTTVDVICERWCVWQSCMWKMVCDKGGCERWCVTKLYDKVVCERWCVTKSCVKDGVWQSCMWKMVCDKVVCERWCVTKLCVEDGVWQSWVWKMVCDKVGCERWHWVARLGLLGRAWRRGTVRGRRGTWWHPPWFHVAGVALGHIHLRFAWQAWHLCHWAGSGGALGPVLVAGDAVALCVAGVALGDIHLRFAFFHTPSLTHLAPNFTHHFWHPTSSHTTFHIPSRVATPQRELNIYPYTCKSLKKLWQISIKALANHHNSRMFSVSSSLPYLVWASKTVPKFFEGFYGVLVDFSGVSNLKNVHLCRWYFENS